MSGWAAREQLRLGQELLPPDPVMLLTLNAGIFVCFGVFILACGATHLMSVYNVWVPAWWVAGGVKTVTALASVPTAVLLYRARTARRRANGPAGGGEHRVSSEPRALPVAGRGDCTDRLAYR